MLFRLFVKECNNPQMLFDEFFKWPVLPRIGDTIVIPAVEDKDNTLRDREVEVKDILWCPTDINDLSPAINVIAVLL